MQQMIFAFPFYSTHTVEEVLTRWNIAFVKKSDLVQVSQEALTDAPPATWVELTGALREGIALYQEQLEGKVE